MELHLSRVSPTQLVLEISGDGGADSDALAALARRLELLLALAQTLTDDDFNLPARLAAVEADVAAIRESDRARQSPRAASPDVFELEHERIEWLLANTPAEYFPGLVQDILRITSQLRDSAQLAERLDEWEEDVLAHVGETEHLGLRVREPTPGETEARLSAFEQKYGLSSEQFYDLWQRGEADHFPDRVEWSILYDSRSARHLPQEN